MLLRKGCVLTLASKHKKSIFWVYSTFGSEIQISINLKKTINLISRHKINNFKTGFNHKLNQDFKILCHKINTTFHRTF